MSDDFAAAAVRHFRDGDFLSEDDRVSNADQLFGFAAECAIKSALVSLPAVKGSGELSARYRRKHIDELWDCVLTQHIPNQFKNLQALLASRAKPFMDWSTNQRYGPDDAVTEVALTVHRNAARRALGSVGLLGTRKER